MHECCAQRSYSRIFAARKTQQASRGPISISGPIFRVEDRAEDVVRLANVVVVYVDGVELVAIKVKASRALCFNSEEIRKQV